MLTQSDIQKQLLTTAIFYDHQYQLYNNNAQLLNNDGSQPIIRLTSVNENKALAFLPNFQLSQTYYRVTWVSDGAVPSNANWSLVGNNAIVSLAFGYHERKAGFYWIYLYAD